MIAFKKLVMPIIVIIALAGIASFILAYNFYPKKHVNININGDCYELLDDAYIRYQDLVSQRNIRILKLQIDAIEQDDAIIDISLAGSREQVQELSKRYDIKVISQDPIGDRQNNITLDSQIVRAQIKKLNLESLINNLTAQDIDQFSKTVQGSIGIQSTAHITASEREQIASEVKQFMRAGLEDIISAGDGVKAAECRSKIKY